MDKGNEEERRVSLCFQGESIQDLVQKFVLKDTQSSIRLNTSTDYQIGLDNLGDTFQGDS